MSGDKMDRYIREELSPTEARELAQASLESPELFAELADTALAKAALRSGKLPSDKVVRFPRKAWFLAAAAAAVLIYVVVARPWHAATPHLKPVLALTSQGQPVLLADGLRVDQAPVFRGQETDSRAPKTAGSIVAIDDGVANIDLGSLDGLAKDSELQVFRDERPAETIARFQVTTVFRERARGRIVEGEPVRVGDRVLVDDATHLDALVDQVDALYNRGDADGAYKMAEQVDRWAETAHVPPLRQTEWLNQLGVLRMLHGDYQGAEDSLNKASGPQSLNNLGVLAELRGERRKAESLYVQAVHALPNAPEQELRAVEANLSRVRGSH